MKNINGVCRSSSRRHKQQRRQQQAPLNDRERRTVRSAVAGTKNPAKNWSRLDTRTRTRSDDKTISTRNLSVRKPARPCSTRGPAPVVLSSSTPRRTPAPRGSARTCRNRTRNGQPRQRIRRRALSNTERGTIRSAATTRSPGRIAPTDRLREVGQRPQPRVGDFHHGNTIGGRRRKRKRQATALESKRRRIP